VEHLRRALELVPAEQRALYWRENVTQDAALYAIRNTPGFLRLAGRYGGRAK
jgi:hypothetical protein